jgi:hypothetical protein
VAVAVFCTGALFHEYVYGPIPPVAVAVADPVLPPKQAMFVDAEIEAVGPPELVTTATAVVVQPFASVTVTV